LLLLLHMCPAYPCYGDGGPCLSACLEGGPPVLPSLVFLPPHFLCVLCSSLPLEEEGAEIWLERMCLSLPAAAVEEERRRRRREPHVKHFFCAD